LILGQRHNSNSTWLSSATLV